MALLQADPGLDLILPLFSFLKETCKDAVYHFFVTEFREAQYVTENLGICVKGEMTLYSFLLHINQTFKDDKGGKDSKNKLKKFQSSPQASCSNPQQNLQHRSFSHPSQNHQNFPVHGPGSQQHPAHLNQYSNQPQATANNQHAAQTIEDLWERLPSEIQNVQEKETILKKLTVNNLLNRDDDACQVLHKLDLNFIVNVIINKHIRFRLNEELMGAFKNMKNVRLSLVHASYYFTDAHFEENLGHLVQAVTVVRKALHLPDQLVQERADLCRDETKSGNKAQEILGKCF